MKIQRENIIEYAREYDERYKGTSDELIEKGMKKILRQRKYLTREEFIKIGLWKSKRQEKNYKSRENDDLTVREITEFAFKVKSERARIKSLTVLKGVSWPVASVILHFASPNKYPILDFRVIWSLGWEQPKQYDFNFWQRYIKTLKSLAKQYKVSLRDLDKGFWEYSKENQP